MNTLLDTQALFDKQVRGLCPLCAAILSSEGALCEVCSADPVDPRAGSACSECGGRADLADSFCPQCFIALEREAGSGAPSARATAVLTTRICRKCGERNPPTADDCGACWEPLRPPAAVADDESETGAAEIEDGEEILDATDDIIEALEEIPPSGLHPLEEPTVAEAMRRCPLCGYENLARAEFCGACWGRLPSAQSSTSSHAIDAELYDRWQVHGVKTGFVGRAVELDRLAELVDHCGEKREAALALVLGAPGIGKSRLVAEFMRWLLEHRSEVRILATTCNADEPAAALGPLARLFRERFELREHVGALEAQERVRRIVAEVCQGSLVEDISTRFERFLGLSSAGTDAGGGSEGEDQSQDQRSGPGGHRQLGALARFLEEDARRTPLLLCIDDVHHAPPELLGALHHIVGAVRDAPLTLVLLARPTLVEMQRSWVESAAAKVSLGLEALTKKESTRLVKGILAPSGFDASLVAEICKRGEGNPLFLEELCRIALEEGPVAVRSQPLPGNVDEAVRQRLQFVSEPARAALRMAAVVGTRFWLGALASLRRLDEQGAEPPGGGKRYWFGTDEAEEIRRSLEELRGRDFITRNPQPSLPEEEEYLFKHGTERELVYEDVPKEQRVRWHLLLSQWLLRREGDDEARFSLAARHRELSGDEGGSARLYFAAADRARASGEPERAAEFYERGLKLLPMSEIGTRLAVLHGLGESLVRCGEFDRALDWFRAMLHCSWLLGDQGKSGAAYNRIGRIFRHLGRYDEAMASLSDGHTLFLEARDWRGVASSLDDIGQVHRRRGRYDQAVYHFQEALQLRRELGDPRGISLSMYNLGELQRDAGRLREAESNLEEALRIIRETSDHLGQSALLSALAVLRHEQGDASRAASLWEEALSIAREHRDRDAEGRVLFRMGELSLAKGDLPRARQLLTESLEIARVLEDRAYLSPLLRALAETALRGGDIEGSRELADDALRTAQEIGSRLDQGVALRVLGEVHAQTLFDDAQGRPEGGSQAEACFSRAVQLFEDMQNDLELGRALTSHGNYLLERGQTERGKALLLRAQEILERREAAQSLARAQRTIGDLS